MIETNTTMKNVEWKEFLISDLFNIGTGALLPKKKLKKGKVPRITATDLNNGVFDYYEDVEHKNYRTESNFISVSFLGSVFYHPYRASLDMKIHSLKLKDMDLNKYLAHFIVLALKRTTSLFSYGDQLSSSDLPKKRILLPIDLLGNPHFDFMEEFIKEKEEEKLIEYKDYIFNRIEKIKNFKEVCSLDKKQWGEFEIGKLFKLFPGKSKGLNHLKRNKLGINYLGATNSNNGVLAYVEKEGNEEKIQNGNCIAFIRNGEGSMGFSVYKAENFIATSDISVGYSKYLNREIGLFITTIADKVRGKYNFGYKRSATRLKKEKLQLPINNQGTPDYEYMENYIKKLEYKKLAPTIKE